MAANGRSGSEKNDPEETPGKKVIDVSFPEATRNWSRYHKISGLKSDKEMTTDRFMDCELPTRQFPGCFLPQGTTLWFLHTKNNGKPPCLMG